MISFLRGLFLPVRINDKATYLSGWSSPDLDQPALKPGENVALRLEHVTDVDPDCPEAVAFCPTFLPPTECSFGRPTGVTHYFYDTEIKSEEITDEDGKTIIEIRHGFGNYTVIPPSLVARKDDPQTIDTLSWVNEGSPSHVDASHLRQMVLYVAATVILARKWSGGRHNLAQHAAGYLVRHGVEKLAVLQIIKQAADWASDIELEDRIRVARDTCDAFAAKRAITGGPELAKIIGDRSFQILHRLFGTTTDGKTADEQKAWLKDRERIKREIRRELDAEERGVQDNLQFLSESDLLGETPAPELVEGLLVQGCVFMIFGPKNLGKTFLTIALGYAVALGRAFLGLPIRRHGDVVLVLAEGGSRLGLRLRAWRQMYGVDDSVSQLHVLKRPVNLTDAAAIDRFIDGIRAWNPVLVVFDTLSRCMPGAVENAAEDMSAAVASCDRIRLAIPGVTVGVIHHPTKASDDVERGAGTFANALDTVMNVKDDDGVFTLSCKYTRDLEPFAAITYALDPWQIRGIEDAEGRPYGSAVVKRLSADDADRAKDEARTLEQQILAALRDRGPLSGSDLTAVVKARKETVLSACNRLKAEKQIKSVGPKNRPQWELTGQLRLVPKDQADEF